MAGEEQVRPEAEATGSTPENPEETDRHTADSSNERSAESGEREADDRQTADDETARLHERINELEAENSELKNQYLRKQADMENYRKRMIRDKEDAVNYANQQLLLDLTAIIDDFERAISSAEESRDYDAFHDGIVLIEKQLVGMLERKWGLKRFESTGKEFDPQKHEAVTTEPRQDHDTSIVLEEYQRGYMLRERVLRSAKVKVSMPSND